MREISKVKSNRKGYLVDTNIFIWLMEKNSRIKPELFSLLEDAQTQVFISVASIWEIIIKRRKIPFKIPQNILKGIELVSFQILKIEASHAINVEKLPNIHNDPFDRIIISQSQVENLTLITSDEKIWKYNTKIIKC